MSGSAALTELIRKGLLSPAAALAFAGGKLQSQAVGIQYLFGGPEGYIDAYRRNIGVRSNAPGTTQAQEVGLQYLYEFALTTSVDTYRRSLGVQSDALGTVQAQEVGLQYLLDSAPPTGVDAYRRAVGVLSNAAGTLQASELGLQYLQELFPDDSSIPIAPIDDNSFLFLANWASKVKVASSWNTEDGRSPDTGKTEFLSLGERPKRMLTFSWMFTRKPGVSVDVDLDVKATQLFTMLQNLTSKRTLIPLYPDAAKVSPNVGDFDPGVLWSSDDILTSDDDVLMSSGSEAITSEFFVDVTGKRFHPYKAVAFFGRGFDYHLIPTTVSMHTMRTVDAGSSTITLLGESLPELDFTNTDWWAVPLVYCEIIARPVVTVLTPESFEVSVTVKEVFGPTALPALYPPPEDPLPYWSVAPNFDRKVEHGYQREIISDEQGRDIFFEAEGIRYRHTQEWTVSCARGEWYYSVMPFWDGLRGRWRPMVVSEQQETNTFLSGTGNDVFLQPDDTADFSALGFTQFRERLLQAGYLVLEMTGGTYFLSQIEEVVNLNFSWVVSLVDPLPSPLEAGQVQRVYPARIYRFANDSTEEVWHNTNVVEMNFSLIEDENPGSVSIL